MDWNWLKKILLLFSNFSYLANEYVYCAGNNSQAIE